MAVTISKTASRSVVAIGDTFTYVIAIVNQGPYEAVGMVLTDSLPSPQFIVEHILVDEMPALGDLGVGLPLGTILIGQTLLIKVQIKVGDTFNTPNQPYMNTAIGTYSYNTIVTNTTGQDPVGVTILDPKLRLEKSSDVEQIVVGDELIYTLIATNEGDMDLEKVEIVDLLTPDLDFVEGSVTVGGIGIPTANILEGVDVGPLLKTQSKVITFKANVVSKHADFIRNQSRATYTYRLQPGDKLQTGSALSNPNEVLLEVAELTLTKVADKKRVSLKEKVTYTVEVINTGSIPAVDVVFMDEISQSAQLVPESILVNGVRVNDPDLSKGINIGRLEKGERALIVYTVEVIGGACNGKLENEAYASFYYVLPNQTTGPRISHKVRCCICLNIAIFHQLTMDKFCPVPCQKPNIEEVDEIHVEAEVLNTYVIKTHQGVSNEGQVLSGYKLIVNGLLHISIQYTADCITQPIHSYHCEVAFGDFMILPPDYVMGKKIKVDVKVEDIDAEMLDERGIYANIVYMLIAKVCL